MDIIYNEVEKLREGLNLVDDFLKETFDNLKDIFPESSKKELLFEWLHVKYIHTARFKKLKKIFSNTNIKNGWIVKFGILPEIEHPLGSEQYFNLKIPFILLSSDRNKFYFVPAQSFLNALFSYTINTSGWTEAPLSKQEIANEASRILPVVVLTIKVAEILNRKDIIMKIQEKLEEIGEFKTSNDFSDVWLHICLPFLNEIDMTEGRELIDKMWRNTNNDNYRKQYIEYASEYPYLQKLLKATNISNKDLEKLKNKNLKILEEFPIIYLPEMEIKEKDNLLFLMCIYAYKQNKSEEYMYYVKDFLKEHRIKNTEGITGKVLMRFKFPLSSFSIKGCIKLLMKEVKRENEEKKTSEYKGDNFPLTIPQASRKMFYMLGREDYKETSEAIESWLYRHKKDFCFLQNKSIVRTPEGFNITKETCYIDEENFDRALNERRIWLKKKEFYDNESEKIYRESVHKRFYRKRKKGIPIEEILAQENLKKKSLEFRKPLNSCDPESDEAYKEEQREMNENPKEFIESLMN